MCRRNLFLSYQEWVLLCEELSEMKWHPFQLKKDEIKEWKDDIKMGYNEYCFERINIHGIIDHIQNPIVFNALCREYFRLQDNILDDVISFIGFIINSSKSMNICHDNVAPYQWQVRFDKVTKALESVNQRYIHINQVEKVFYQECMPQVLVAQ